MSSSSGQGLAGHCGMNKSDGQIEDALIGYYSSCTSLSAVLDSGAKKKESKEQTLGLHLSIVPPLDSTVP